MTLPHGAEVFCECGDRLIHQHNRGAHESSSLLGDYIHRCFPQTFYYMDADMVFYKSRDRRLLFAEHKFPGQILKPSQQCLLPLMGRLIQLGVDNGLLVEGESLQIVGAPPWDNCSITSYPDRAHRDSSIADLLREQPNRLFVPTAPVAAAWSPAHVIERGD